LKTAIRGTDVEVPDDEDEDKGKDEEWDEDEVPEICTQSRPSTHLRSWLAARSPQARHATHLWLQLATLYLIVSQYLREGVEDLLVCSGNM